MPSKRDKMIKSFVRKTDPFGKKFGASAGDRIKQRPRPGYQPHGDPLDNYIENSRNADRRKYNRRYGSGMFDALR